MVKPDTRNPRVKEKENPQNSWWGKGINFSILHFKVALCKNYYSRLIKIRLETFFVFRLSLMNTSPLLLILIIVLKYVSEKLNNAKNCWNSTVFWNYSSLQEFYRIRKSFPFCLKTSLIKKSLHEIKEVISYESSNNKVCMGHFI